MSTCGCLGEKHPANQLSPGSLKSTSREATGSHGQAVLLLCPLGTGRAPRASCLPSLTPSSQSCPSPSLWPRGGAALPAPWLLSASFWGSQLQRVTAWAPAWMDRAVGSHLASWMETGCITGCPHPRVGDRGQLLLASGRALSRRHASPRSGAPLAVVQSLILLDAKTSARRVTPEVPSTPEKTGVILNELPAFCGRILLLAAFCRHGYAQKAPMIPCLCVHLR